jgi:lipopolysaccharide transport protein LptA
LSSKTRTTIQRADFNIVGDSVEFDTNSRNRSIGRECKNGDHRQVAFDGETRHEPMKKLIALVLIVACAFGARLYAQTASATPKAVAAAPKAVAAAPKAVAATSPKKAKKTAEKDNKSPGNSLFGQSAMGLNTNEPTTTEIYSDEAFFDSTKNMGIFSGRVKVTDPRFNLQSDKLTVFITKGENQGLEKAIAEGNVGLVRERPDPSGGPPTRAVGRADNATYTAATGDVELRGTPRVQEGPNMHVATQP